jgi:hypothetical protein
MREKGTLELNLQLTHFQQARKMDSLSDSEILEKLKIAEEDSKWFSEKYDDLRRKFEGKVVAVKNKNIIGDAESVEELLNMVQKKGEDTAYMLIETIPAKDVSFIL